MRTLIVNGGSIEDDFALDFLANHRFDYILAADRGMEFLLRVGILPDQIVGDFDSAREGLSEKFADRGVTVRRFRPQKDSTDMEIAMETALAAGSTEICVLGATGSRIDHVLGSIRNLSMALNRGIPCCLVDAYNRIRMVDHGLTIGKEEQYGKYISLLAHGGPVTGLTLEGFFYPLKNHVLSADSALGISNEIVEKEGRISFQGGKLLVIESRDEKKSFAGRSDILSRGSR
ncbi:MAG: thiamine diphosphokinase [Eubacteriales bacterium]|nr:thiamine diphosphokinase [Eubacteriales bacterium]